MKLFAPIYETLLAWAKHRFAKYYLAAVSFAESSFFPIPVDVMLAPMVLARPTKWFSLALITTIFSVLGGVFGYFIGVFFFDAYGAQILNYFNAHDTFEQIKPSYHEHGLWIILLAGFTPIPYKVFTIASGVLGIALLPFVVLSVIGRGARFFLVAGLVRLGGERLENTIHEHVERLGWLAIALVVIGGTLYYYH